MALQTGDNMVIQRGAGPAKRVTVDTLKTFFLSVAASGVIGAVKPGTGLTIDLDGTLNATGTTSPDGTDTVKGIVRLATTAEATAGTLETVVITPKQLSTAVAAATGGGITTLTPTAPITASVTGVTGTIGINAASDSAIGAVKLASSAEITAGTSTSAVVTVAQLKANTPTIADATTSAKGVVQLATDVNTGGDVVLTAAQVKGAYLPLNIATLTELT